MELKILETVELYLPNKKTGLPDEVKISKISRKLRYDYNEETDETLMDEPKEHRRIDCCHYEFCLTLAAKRLFKSFSCSQCPQFKNRKMKRRKYD